jgi:hypothetical protein
LLCVRLHQEHAIIRGIVTEEELSPWSARPLHYNFLCKVDFGFVHLSNQRRNNMRVMQVVRISRSE